MENNSYRFDPDGQIKNLGDIYIEYFGYKNEGFFVDIGAYDGVTFSNTSGLAFAGWEGICYEPLPYAYESCSLNYAWNKKVKVINCAVGNRNGEVEFHIGGTISTYSDYYRNTDFWKKDYTGQVIRVPIVRLDDSLHENNAPIGFDVLSLDVEGSETDVLMYFDVLYWKPKMAIVEVQELHPAKELRNQAPFINKFFDDAGYDKIYCDEINNIYVRNEERLAKEEMKRKIEEEERIREERRKIKEGLSLEMNSSTIKNSSSFGV